MPREHNTQRQFIQAESIVRPIGNKAKAKAEAKCKIKNKAETKISSNNIAKNLVKENPVRLYNLTSYYTQGMGSASPREIRSSEVSLIYYRQTNKIKRIRLDKSDAKISKNAGLLKGG